MRAASAQGQALCRAYRAEGADFPRLMGGHFACAVIDPNRERVVLAVDRMGIHSLYYAVLPQNGAAFGTRAANLLPSSGLPEDVSEQAIYDYLYFHMIPAPGTAFRGLSKVEPACVVVLEKGQRRSTEYWRPDFRKAPPGGPRALERALRPALRAAVTRASASARKAGAFLSGGLDSSSVTGMLAARLNGSADAYSIGFGAEGYDEMGYARIAAHRFGVRLHEYYVTPANVVDAVPMIADAYDEPFGNSSALPAYYCAKLAADDGIDLMLAGDGGDELFAGNDRYRVQLLFERFNAIPGFLRRRALVPLIRGLGGFDRPSVLRRAGAFVRLADIPLPERLQSYNFLHRTLPEEMFDADFLSCVDQEGPTAQLRRRFQAPEGPASALDRMLFLDWKFTLADNDLRKVSTMCQLAGVRVEYPMLDQELIDLSCRIPDGLKLSQLKLRRFYKGAMKGFLPDAILSKKKHGFGLPFGIWMRSHAPLREMTYDHVAQLKGWHVLRPEFLDRAIDLHRTGHAGYYGELLWILMMLSMWRNGAGRTALDSRAAIA
ncbi:MAG: asparagine synthase C-terminal domain-containing protein [Chromatiales bacterium]